MDIGTERPVDPAAPSGPPDHRVVERQRDDGAPAEGKTDARIDRILSEDTLDLDAGDVLRAPKERGLILTMAKDEVIRAAVALLLLALLTYVIYMAFRRAKTWDETKQLLDGALPAVTALLGSAVGFYFGTKSG